MYVHILTLWSMGRHGRLLLVNVWLIWALRCGGCSAAEQRTAQHHGPTMYAEVPSKTSKDSGCAARDSATFQQALGFCSCFTWPGPQIAGPLARHRTVGGTA